MELIAFLTGVFVTLAVLLLLLPWIRRLPTARSLAEPSLKSVLAALALLALAAALGHWSGESPRVAAAGGARLAPAIAVPPAAPVAPGPTPAAGTKAAGPMGGAIASLEARLAKGGGTADDWELLAKSFEFVGRPADAAKARAHELPPTADAGEALPRTAAPAGSGTFVTGEITLAPALAARVDPGMTLFIVAKSVDAPGPPLAVYRGVAGSWPHRFSLDDSQSMLPGRNLSSASRVTIEARISRAGTAAPTPGDLQGASGVINPAAHRPVSIEIDRVIG